MAERGLSAFAKLCRAAGGEPKHQSHLTSGGEWREHGAMMYGRSGRHGYEDLECAIDGGVLNFFQEVQHGTSTIGITLDTGKTKFRASNVADDAEIENHVLVLYKGGERAGTIKCIKREAYRPGEPRFRPECEVHIIHKNPIDYDRYD